MKQKLQLFLVLLALAGLPACGTLDPAGPYKSDKVLYDADYTIATSYETVHSFVLWEYQNRATLTNSAPEVRKVADAIRMQAPTAFRSAIALRDAYAAAPNPDTQTALNKALAVLHGMVSEAIKYLTTVHARLDGRHELFHEGQETVSES